jgi:hypothetical protein
VIDKSLSFLMPPGKNTKRSVDFENDNNAFAVPYGNSLSHCVACCIWMVLHYLCYNPSIGCLVLFDSESLIISSSVILGLAKAILNYATDYLCRPIEERSIRKC